MWLLALLACSGDPAPAPVPVVETPAAPEREALPRRFVRASKLNVRTDADASAQLMRKLPINRAVDVLELQPTTGWARIRMTGGEGWVRSEYLAEAPLDLATAKAEASKAADPASRLSWWQRATALDSTDDEVLAHLEAAYAEVGDPAAAAAVKRARALPSTDLWNRWFTVDLQTRANRIRDDLEGARTDEAMAALWRRAMGVADELTDVVSLQFGLGEEETDKVTAAEAMIDQKLPWLALSFYAEGTAAVLELDTEAWTGAARLTTGTEDDRFFAFLMDSYSNLNGDGWATWQERTWDYGGCSPLGSGLHLELLKQAEDLDGGRYHDTVAGIRASCLADITGLRGEFPFCRPGGEGPTPVAQLDAETAKILATIALSDAERVSLEQARARKFAEPPH